MRILIIEDEIKLANLLKKTLEAEHYAVDVCYDGEEGYEQASVEEYDLLLLDLNLPGMHGLEVCKNLREDEVKTPILMLTARDRIEDKVMGLDHGADDYLVKPFEIEELLARVRALLRRESSQAGSLLTVGDLSLDPKSHEVMRGKKLIQLSAKEYAMVEYFMRRPGQVLSKMELLDHIWGGDIDPFSNVVDVYVGYIRKKIDKAFENKKPLLTTIKGLGYRLG